MSSFDRASDAGYSADQIRRAEEARLGGASTSGIRRAAGAEGTTSAYSSSASASAPGVPAATTPDTYDPAANVVTDVSMGLDPFPDWAAPDLASKFATSGFDAATKAFDKTDEMLAGLRDKNQSWLRGEISGDVADQLRSQAALGARAGGAGADSQMSRNLQARDFGSTSMQIQERGMALETGLTQAQASMAQIREQRSQFMQQTLEQSRQFGASNALDQTRTQLMHKELMLKQDAFNAEQNMKLIDMISSLATTQGSLQISAAQSGKVDISGVNSTFESLLGQIGALLKKSNPEN